MMGKNVINVGERVILGKGMDRRKAKRYLEMWKQVTLPKFPEHKLQKGQWVEKPQTKVLPHFLSKYPKNGKGLSIEMTKPFDLPATIGYKMSLVPKSSKSVTKCHTKRS